MENYSEYVKNAGSTNGYIDDRKIEMCGLLHEYLLLLYEDLNAKTSKSPNILQTEKYGRIQ